jgi:hypothetical protein
MGLPATEGLVVDAQAITSTILAKNIARFRF